MYFRKKICSDKNASNTRTKKNDDSWSECDYTHVQGLLAHIQGHKQLQRAQIPRASNNRISEHSKMLNVLIRHTAQVKIRLSHAVSPEQQSNKVQSMRLFHYKHTTHVASRKNAHATV